jgi:hypothetical protein
LGSGLANPHLHVFCFASRRALLCSTVFPLVADSSSTQLCEMEVVCRYRISYRYWISCRYRGTCRYRSAQLPILFPCRPARIVEFISCLKWRKQGMLPEHLMCSSFNIFCDCWSVNGIGCRPILGRLDRWSWSLVSAACRYTSPITTGRR